MARSIHRLMIAAVAVASLYAPRALQAQSVASATKPAASAAPQKVDPKLEAFAILHFALNLARDEYNATLSQAHEPGAKDEAMDAFELRRSEILTSMGTTQQAYFHELYLVSSDVAQREVFYRLMKEMAAR